MSNPTGGPAFPSAGVVLDIDKMQRQQGAYEGMSLRDYFAGLAMQANVAKTRSINSDIVARNAYITADAMLKERLK